MDLEKKIIEIAGFMAVSARTAPKAKGVDNIKIKIFSKEELVSLAEAMKETGKKTDRPDTFNRDSDSIKKTSCLLVIATTSATLKLDCGFCGFNTCGEAEKSRATCAYNSGDLGIAVGSAVSTAADFKVDNRIMYTAGYTVKKKNLMGKDIRMALGIPLSATGKNPFFDR
ncbi:MAG: DUF2148 domain-containing protein [Elusimicrobia bacterium]|jgi:uncharacterized ferredoxin-like protein|nr:DUF2148 domain-containing protein [Elusimicrobiota bacterium]